MKKIISILALILIFGIGLYIGYEFIPNEKTESKNVNKAELTNEAQMIDLEAQLELSEREQMYAVAREYIKEYSAEGMVVNLEIIKLLEKWALLRVMPINIETDVATMVMEKVNGKWETRQFGTALPEWEEKVPELFE